MEQDCQTRDVVRRTDRERREGRLLGSTYQPGGVSATKRTGYGPAREGAFDASETRQRLAVLEGRSKSARDYVSDSKDERVYDHRQTRRRIEDERYDDCVYEGLRMPVEIQSSQLNPMSQDQPALSVRSGATADGAWTYRTRVDIADFPRSEYGRGEYHRSRSLAVGRTEQMRSGMAALGSAQGKYPRAPTYHDAGTNSQNAWG